MAKKLFFITFIATIISGLITLAFIPLAMEDVGMSIAEYTEENALDSSVVTLQDKKGIEKIQILGWYDRVILEESRDNSMSVTKDQIATQLTGVFSDKREILNATRDNIYCVRYSNSYRNEVSLLFSRQNIMKVLSAAFTNEQKVLTVYVPKGMEVYFTNEPYVLENNGDIPVYIDDNSKYSNDNYIAYKSIDPNEQEINQVAPPTDVTSSSPSDSIASSSQATDLATVRTELGEIMTKYNEAYKAYIKSDATDDTIIFSLNDLIDPQLEILLNVSTATNEYLGNFENHKQVKRYAELCIQDNLLEIKSELLEDSYEKGKITKADYYAQDLELDQEENALDTEMLSYAQVSSLLHDWQKIHIITIPFLYDVD